MATLEELRAEHARLGKMLEHWYDQQGDLYCVEDRAYAERQYADTLAKLGAIAHDIQALTGEE